MKTKLIGAGFPLTGTVCTYIYSNPEEAGLSMLASENIEARTDGECDVTYRCPGHGSADCPFNITKVEHVMGGLQS